jgi:hypothetical protein
MIDPFLGRLRAPCRAVPRFACTYPRHGR